MQIGATPKALNLFSRLDNALRGTFAQKRHAKLKKLLQENPQISRGICGSTACAILADNDERIGCLAGPAVIVRPHCLRTRR